MLVIFDFRCTSCGFTFEKLIKRGTPPPDCSKCEGTTEKILLQAPKLDWGGMAQGANAGPEFIDRWERNHKQQKQIEEKSMANHGDYGSSPGSD